MGIMDELKRLARPYEDEDEDETVMEAEEKPSSLDEERRKRSRVSDADFTGSDPKSNRYNTYNAGDKVVNIHTTTQLKVVLVKPEKFEDASVIADHLRDKRTVVLNLESTNKDVSRRLVDFLSGVAYAQEGKIKKVAVSTYIITPYNVDIIGDLLDELESSGMHF